MVIETAAKTGIFEGLTLESRVAWALPNRTMIDRVRDSGPSQRELWIIGGDYRPIVFTRAPVRRRVWFFTCCSKAVVRFSDCKGRYWPKAAVHLVVY